MKISSSSLVFCFIIITCNFALKCHSQGDGYTNDLRIGRKEMRYGRTLEEGQGQAHGLELGHGQEMGLGQGLGHEHEQGNGQQPGHEMGLGSEHGQGQGHEAGQGQGLGQAQGSEHGNGQSQGQGLGQAEGSGQGLGQSQGPEHGHEQTHGPGQGLGQTPGQSQGPGHGETHEQEQPHGMGSGLGQAHEPEHGHGQGQGQGQGHGLEHGHGQGQGHGPEHGHGYGPGHGHGPGHGDNHKGGRVGGMFVFGSSLVDNGNNMFLPTLARPHSLPYGIDFPAGPTGRFTNGKNVIDVFTDLFKLPQLPTFHDPSPNHTKNILNGVNFASGGSGIISITGAISGRVSWFKEQISNFEHKVLPKLEDELKARREEFLADYIFVIGVGGNDYTLNYFLNPIKLQSLEGFTKTIVKSLSHQIKKLYSLGARKFIIMAAYPMGCYPKNRKETGCNDRYNEGATLYNFHLKSMIDNLMPQLPGSHFAFVDTYNIVMDLINNPQSRGFKNAKDACCELRQLIPFKKGGMCKKNGHVCKDRNAYVFFDGIHPTQKVNEIIGSKAFTSSHASEVYPINLSKLASL